MTPIAPKFFALLCASVLSASAGAGEFYQLDAGTAGTSVVAVKAWDQLKLTAVHARWNREGRATSLALTKSLPQALAGVQFAWGVHATDHRSLSDAPVPSDHGLGLKLSAEWQPQWAAGQGYFLLERASVFGTWVAVAQFKPKGRPVSIEWAAAGDDRWYVGRSVSLRYALPDSRWSLRLGRRQNDQRLFVGLNYNSF